MLSKTVCLWSLLFLSPIVWGDATQVKRNEQRIDDFINGILECTDLPGLVLSVVNRGETYLTKGYGVKDINTRAPMTDETLVLIASVSKAFTATLMAKILDERRNEGCVINYFRVGPLGRLGIILTLL